MYTHHWTVWQLEFFSSFFSFFFFFFFFFFFPISFILCSYTFIGLIALVLAHYIVYCPLWIGNSMSLYFPLVSSHELHLVHTVFLFGCFVNHVPYIHTYEHAKHQPPIDYLCTCSCSWMGSHTWHWYLHFMCLNCIMVAVVYIYLLSIEQVDTDVIGVR